MSGSLGAWNKKIIRLKILCYFDIQKFSPTLDYKIRIMDEVPYNFFNIFW